ncbi:MAG: efflux RND transporter periplasmic adaptor subunit [Planctomycetes bacterium]|nr:efflux RND transporter periplasmic adaptor subunit [Planctomycetota bacterium]
MSVLGICIACLSGCGSEPSQGGIKPDEASIKVIVATPVEQQVTDYMDYTGRTEAVEFVEIRPRVSGYLTKVEFMGSLDSEVKAGDLLFQIDDRPYLNALASAEARLASANAAHKTSSAELERTESLFKKGVVVQSELDRDVGRKAQADADILGAQAGIDQAKLDLEFTRITAPIGGNISKPNMTIGNLVTPASPSLTSIVSVDPIYVYFDLDEPTMLQIQKNIREGKLPTGSSSDYKILLGLINDEGYPYSGTLDFVDNRVDPNTGTIRVRGIFKNPKPERGKRALSPGLFARVRVPLGDAHNALLVSERAVVRDQGKTTLYVVGADNKIGVRKIQLGSQHGGLRVVTGEIQSGDKIVISGLQRVRLGSLVDPVVKDMPGMSAMPAGTEAK